jgi:hypothetical protein
MTSTINWLTKRRRRLTGLQSDVDDLGKHAHHLNVILRRYFEGKLPFQQIYHF